MERRGRIAQVHAILAAADREGGADQARSRGESREGQRSHSPAGGGGPGRVLESEAITTGPSVDALLAARRIRSPPSTGSTERTSRAAGKPEGSVTTFKQW